MERKRGVGEIGRFPCRRGGPTACRRGSTIAGRRERKAREEERKGRRGTDMWAPSQREERRVSGRVGATLWARGEGRSRRAEQAALVGWRARKGKGGARSGPTRKGPVRWAARGRGKERATEWAKTGKRKKKRLGQKWERGVFLLYLFIFFQILFLFLIQNKFKFEPNHV